MYSYELVALLSGPRMDTDQPRT